MADISIIVRRLNLTYHLDLINMDYQPMSREIHQKRGYCCKSLPECVFCPWHQPNTRPIKVYNEEIVEALQSGEVRTIYIKSQSLVPTLTLLDRVTIVYHD